MRERLERCVLLPFSLGCISESSVLVRSPHCHNNNSSKRSSSEHQQSPYHIPTPTRNRRGKDDEEDDEDEEEDEDGQSLPRFQRLMKNIKSFSQLLLYKEEEDEIGDDEVSVTSNGKSMEIGYPTDVKHVTHIGLDGANWKPPPPSTAAAGGGGDIDFFNASFPLPPPAVATADHGGT